MSRNTFLIITVLAMLMILCSCQQKASEEELFDNARTFQESQEYEKAIGVYRDIVKLYPGGEKSDEAQFMVGFIYANDLNDTENALASYKVFLENYGETADSGMVLSAQWEIENLGRDINDIDELKDITGEESNTGPFIIKQKE